MPERREPRTSPAVTGPVLTGRLVAILVSALCFYIATGMTTPLLAIFVKDDLGGGAVVIGLVVGTVAVSAVLIRPVLAPLVERLGGPRVMLVSLVAGSVAFAAAGLVANSAELAGLRLVTGAAQASLLVAAMTTVTAAVVVERRGEAISYFTVAPYLGIALGPVVGRAVADAEGTRAALLASGAVCILGILPLLFVRNDTPSRPAPAGRQPTIHRGALLPGAALALGLLGMVAMNAFLPLYLRQIGSDNASWYFVEFGAIVLAFRTAGARTPDRLGAARAGTAAAFLILGGLLAIATAPSPLVVLVGIAPFAAGIALQYPGLMAFALGRAEAADRARAVSTFTMFLDIAMGAGGVVVGVVAAVAGYRAVFGATAATAGLSFVLLMLLVRASHRETAAVREPAGASSTTGHFSATVD